MTQPTQKTAFPTISQSHLTAESPASGRTAFPYHPAPERYWEPRLLTEFDYRLDDTLTEEAGMARNPGVLGAYAGSF
ncbi:hypothetical protein GCM10028824_05730 [Hymenobacter segetis]|uniref:Uncharacterized protein n=1 Tax=Hymenobacter segetis TaxID=2025509 RepID=A0ABU9LVZ2_9BACT